MESGQKDRGLSVCADCSRLARAFLEPSYTSRSARILRRIVQEATRGHVARGLLGEIHDRRSNGASLGDRRCTVHLSRVQARNDYSVENAYKLKYYCNHYFNGHYLEKVMKNYQPKVQKVHAKEERPYVNTTSIIFPSRKGKCAKDASGLNL